MCFLSISSCIVDKKIWHCQLKKYVEIYRYTIEQKNVGWGNNWYRLQNINCQLLYYETFYQKITYKIKGTVKIIIIETNVKTITHLWTNYSQI